MKLWLNLEAVPFNSCFALLPLTDETLAGKWGPLWKVFSLLPTALCPRGIELMGWFPGPDAHQCYGWLVVIQIATQGAQAISPAASVASCLPRFWLISPPVAPPWHHRFCCSAVFSPVTKCKQKKVKETMFFEQFFHLSIFFLLHQFFFFFLWQKIYLMSCRGCSVKRGGKVWLKKHPEPLHNGGSWSFFLLWPTLNQGSKYPIPHNSFVGKVNRQRNEVLSQLIENLCVHFAVRLFFWCEDLFHLSFVYLPCFPSISPIDKNEAAYAN